MIIKYDNKAIKYTNKWISVDSEPTPPPIYQIYTSGTNGSVAAVPTSGISGTEVTLSNTPNTGYQFSSYSVTGATLKNANQFDIGSSDVYVHGNFIPNYNPLNLPPNTMRVRTNGGVPVKGSTATYESATLVQGTTNVYDVYKSGTSFYRLLSKSYNVIEILGANTTGITDMSYMFVENIDLTSVALFDTSSVTNMEMMFSGCYSLTTVPLFDTSSVTNMLETFGGCSSLTTIPLFNTTNVTRMITTFINCYNVQSGALALYQQASTQTNPPPMHTGCFTSCGRDTTTGAAELAQIPNDWK